MPAQEKLGGLPKPRSGGLYVDAVVTGSREGDEKFGLGTALVHLPALRAGGAAADAFAEQENGPRVRSAEVLQGRAACGQEGRFAQRAGA